MTYYRELEFRAASLDRALSARDRLDAIAGVEVFHVHHRPLGVLERARLWIEEHQVRLLIRVDPALEREELRTDHGDPYRMVFDEVIHTVAPAIGAVIDELGATHREIREAILYFVTRPYEEALVRGLEDEVRRAAAEDLFVEGDLRSGRVLGGVAFVLTMRLRGSIPLIQEIAADLRRSGLVAPEGLHVSYR